MNPNDLPRDVTLETPDGLLAAVRGVARGPLANGVESIDRTRAPSCGSWPRWAQ